jgi:DNA helicase HerA-like ATPase
MDLQMTVAPILNFGSLSLNLAEEPWKTQGLRALIAGSSGSGKSHTMNIWCEELQAIGAPFLVIDPDDEYAGLKALPGVIVCGPEGDIRLGSRTWRADVVKAMLDQGAGVVLDLSGLPGLDEQREMYVGVTARLFDAQRARKKAGADLDVVFLLLEEAHIFAPAKNASRAKESIDATYQLARRGRKFGVNLVASTQRPRDLYTDVRSQFNARFIGRLDDDIDHEAVRT